VQGALLLLYLRGGYKYASASRSRTKRATRTEQRRTSRWMLGSALCRSSAATLSS
jgi:hypothetical protein